MRHAAAHPQPEQANLDEQVLAVLRLPTPSGLPAVMNPKRIGWNIGQTITRDGWGPSPQAITAALKRLAAAGRVQRAGRSRTSWTLTRSRS